MPVPNTNVSQPYRQVVLTSAAEIPGDGLRAIEIFVDCTLTVEDSFGNSVLWTCAAGKRIDLQGIKKVTDGDGDVSADCIGLI